MGLDFHGADAHWSYSGFNRFRIRLAKEVSIDLEQMEGMVRGSGGIPWKNTDDIIPFLNHSDCDGSLTPQQCGKIGPRLLELIKDWPSDFDKIQAIRLAEGMAKCAEDKEPLEFC